MSTAGSRTPQPRVDRQSRGDHRLHHQGGGKDLASIESVGQQSANGRGDALRCEGRQRDQAGLHRGPRVGRDETADDDQLDPGPMSLTTAALHKSLYRSVAERQEWVVRHNKTPG